MSLQTLARGGDGKLDLRWQRAFPWHQAFRWQRALAIAAWCIIAVCAAAVFLANLRFGPRALWVVSSDDFFYYAQVARNLARHGVSSFDGIHATNGYHPLWLLALVIATKLFGLGGWLRASTDLPLAVALEAMLFALTMAIAYFSYRLARRRCGVVASCSLQMLTTLFTLQLARSGMEVGLALATLFALLCFRLRTGFRWTGRECFFYGLIAAAMTLARLDSMLLVALLFVFDVLANGSVENKGRRCGLWFSLGMAPVAAYLLSNVLIFHTLLPISGTAKELRRHPCLPSLAALRSLQPFLTWQTFFLFGLCVLIALAALGLIATGKRRIPSGASGFFWAILLFPFLHLWTVATLSDWGIWPWYLYPWPAAGVVAATILFAGRKDDAGQRNDAQQPANAERADQTKQREGTKGSRSLAAPACFIASGLYLIFWTHLLVRSSGPLNNPMVATGVEVRQFTQTHPGVYAMGDRAGAVGYLAQVPVIQLEGLMMDKPFLDNIRQQKDLREVLRHYGVRYYIATFRHVGPDASGCYDAREPAQAGPDSPAMQTRICQSPVAVFQHGEFVNDVFDMQPSADSK